MNYGSNINEFYTKKLIDLNHAFTSFKDINLTNSNNFFLLELLYVILEI